MSEEESKALNHVIFNNFIFLVCLSIYCSLLINSLYTMKTLIISTMLLSIYFIKTAKESLKVMKKQA